MTQPTRARLERAAREGQIVDAARAIAESEGWPAVTVRRLADAIGYSQPVLYGHFPDGRDGIVRAVALDGFRRLAIMLAGTKRDAARTERVATLASRYLAFAHDNPAVYDAMFSMPTDLPFATSAAPPALQAGFECIERAVATPTGDSETRAEVLWSALHGLAELSNHGRLRQSHERARLQQLVELFV